jgi:hypothetical protein
VQIEVVVTVPKYIIKDKTVLDSIALMMTKKTAPEVKALFRATVYGWKYKPTFSQKNTRKANYISEEIWASGGDTNDRGESALDIYSYVNFGTKPHPIPKSGTTYMHFRWGGPGSYKASSKPDIIKSSKHYKTGPFVTMMRVNHPGIKEPRRFDLAIAVYYGTIFRDDMQDAINSAAKKSVSQLNYVIIK